MIDFAFLEEQREDLRLNFLLAKPFSHLVIDNFCEEEKLLQLHAELPEIQTKSRDYVFAANKFEKSRIKDISPLFAELYNDLTSDRFQTFLRFVSNEAVFVDKDFHGGGIHQGKKNSFLDMHIDFNYHPLHKFWYRHLNLLLYLNKDWKVEYGGHLKLKDMRSGEQKSIAVPFNRMIVQLTGKYTLHGYDLTHFPDGMYRTSIAAYAYCLHQNHVEKPRTTDWHPQDGSAIKNLLARIYDPAVKMKNKFFGSSTARNQ
ncbi:2OG-Fe(II) oxygenase [Flavisolibacter ginsenosidimutans]|uniref:2OG-Fe(II) oxygenase n=1 Tax=Flavisolibacter ginsenosidimutans TaxID=661481 RepID=A0A5B8UJ20_9BACT|nr:2OG-Fe(II) oxygenase [Flavisolibacter ginsenosidimutans]QEC56667.1 2OG-Fe(II) oxygenase [Flavisolibacter ginsenosidimutans]